MSHQIQCFHIFTFLSYPPSLFCILIIVHYTILNHETEF
ncbi:hypothetical protein FM106_02130 [Brachybacterium faecium]|nr:hypothetical protein FM106_02130 [Brachybacterium faecium]